jgi:ABC-2 type transport system ATP-binding protein
VGNPELLFLDEPTTGLDPQSRRQLWSLIEDFKSSGRSILLTTHYMDEAEKLCDRVAIVDHGHVIALGTPAELIASIGATIPEPPPRASSHTLEDVFVALTGRTLRDEGNENQLSSSQVRGSVARSAHACEIQGIHQTTGSGFLDFRVPDTSGRRTWSRVQVARA